MDFFAQIISSIVSSAVVGAIIFGIFSWINNRRNARVTERKNDADAENDFISQYKEMVASANARAADERSAKESAVRTVRELLNIAEGQITSLKDTIDRLTATIRTLTDAAGVQQDLIDAITEERDHLRATLAAQQAAVDHQKEELVTQQRELLDLTSEGATS